MTLFKKLSVAATVTALMVTGAIAQDDTIPSGQMKNTESGMTDDMMNGGMSAKQNMDGMMPMMKMMRQMGPMMKACTDMMEAKSGSIDETAPSTDKS